MKTRIVDPHDHGRRFFAVAGVGLTVSLVLATIGYFAKSPAPPVLLLGAAAVTGLAFPRKCQHASWCLIYGCTLGATVFAVPILCWTVLSHGLSAVLQSAYAGPLVLGAVSAGAFGGFAFLIWMLLYRYLLARHIEQDGTMCAKCGYCLEGLPSNICPECGSDFDPLHLARIRRRQPARRTAGHVRLCQWGAALVIGAAILGYHCYRGTLLLRCTLINPCYWMHVTAPEDNIKEESFQMLLGQLAGQVVTPDEFRAVVGPPDLFLTDDTGTYYIYKHRRSGGITTVAYVNFVAGQLVGVGYNVDGVNDHSRFRPFPDD